MNGCTAFIDNLLAEVFRRFHICKVNARRAVHSPWDHFIITLSLVTDMTDATLGASGLQLGIQTVAGGTTKLA
jgi:hypothetical protein